eukprot:11632544-Alexandrium_andersonii.AAC.1
MRFIVLALTGTPASRICVGSRACVYVGARARVIGCVHASPRACVCAQQSPDSAKPITTPGYTKQRLSKV